MARRTSARFQGSTVASASIGFFSKWTARAFRAKRRSDSRRSPLRAGSAQLESLETRVLLSASSDDESSRANYSVSHDLATGVTTVYDDRAYWDNYVSGLVSGGFAGNSMRDLVTQLNTPGGSGNLGPQRTVFGNDDRTRVTNTRDWPSRAVVFLDLQFGTTRSSGSGVLISPYHVLTAGHCVYDNFKNAWATAITAYPGQDGYSESAIGIGRWYGGAKATQLWSNTGWIQDELIEQDWGVVTLDRRIGDNVGWFGTQWYAGEDIFNGMQVTTQGYPIDVDPGFQFRATGPTSQANPLRVWYGDTLDTFGGQSGSGVWQSFGGQDDRIVVVHTQGNDGSGRNSGTRITESRVQQLNSYIDTDNLLRAPTDRPDLVNWDDWFGTTYDTVSTNNIHAGENLTATIYPRNNGTAAAGSFTIRFRLSTDAVYDTSDAILGDVTINSLGKFEWATASLTATIPNVASGQYRVVYRIDSTLSQTEFDEDNNTGAIDTVLSVFAADTNDQISEASWWTRVRMNSPITGNSINFIGDVNMHAFSAYAGERLGIDLDRPSGWLNSYLRLFDAAGTELAFNNNGAAPGEPASTDDAYLEYTFTASGTYYLGVSYFRNISYDPLTGRGDSLSTPHYTDNGPYTITFINLNSDSDDQISEATAWARSVIGTTTATAQIDVPMDVDMYRIQVAAGETFGFDIDRPSGSLDSYLRLFNAAGQQLAFNDDAAGPGESSSSESYLTYTFSTAGLYYIGVSAYQNANYDAGTGAGDTFAATSTGAYTLTVMNIDPDDQISEAIPVSIGSTTGGVINSGLDVDTYAVTVAAGQRLYFDIDRNGGSLDSRLRLFNAAGTQLANNDDGTGPGPEYSGVESYLEYTFTTAGTYYISVSYFQNNTGYSPLTGDGDYTPLVNGVGAYNLNIGFVNQAPVITAATAPAYSIWNDFTNIFGSNAFRVSDVDAGAGIVEATLTGTNVTMSLLTTAGLTFSIGDGTDDSTMTFQGTIAAINTALSFLSLYTGTAIGPTANSVTLSVNDLGNTGLGGSRSTTSTVSWWNTVMDFGVAGVGVLRLFGLQAGETSTLSVVNGQIRYTAQGIDYNTNIALASISEVRVDLRGGDDTFTVDTSAANLNVTLIDAGSGNDYVDASRLVNGVSTLGIRGNGGNDTLIGGQGNDVIYLSVNAGGTAVGNGGSDTIYGSEFDDVIQAGEGDNQILAFGGNDTITAGAGSDYIEAGDGNDQVSAGTGNDTIYGQAGNDALYGDGGNDWLYGGTGDDVYTFAAHMPQGSDQVFEYVGEGTDRLDFGFTDSTVNLTIDLRSTVVQTLASGMSLQLNSGSTFENVVGGAGNDTIIGNSLNNILEGRGGNDSYFGMQGNDTYFGSEGNDTYNFDADSQLNTDSLLGIDNGVDTINLFATTTLGTTLNLGLLNTVQAVNGNLSLNISSDTIIENILGTDLVDNYTGNAADNQFDLRGGDDMAVGLAGNDRFIGGTGNDTLTGGNDNDTYLFDADVVQGTDTLIEAATLAGGIDTLDFSQTNLTTSNLAFDLRAAGVQAIRAGFVSLSLGASNNFENVIGGVANDNIIGNNLANSLAGGGGNDLIYGFAGNDILDGGLGNDTYMFDADSNIGSDTVIDAGGTDTLNWLATTTGSGVTVDLASTATQNVFASGFHMLTLTDGNSIENVIGTNQNDDLRGNALSNVFTANGADDQLEGRGGNDTLIGGAGNDIYWFNADNVLGSDLLNESGGGIDILSFFDTQITNLNIDLRIAGWQVIAAGNLRISLQNATAFETVWGGQANDRIIGNTINNFLYGYAGNDIIYGQGGNDYIWGGDGNDMLVGDAGRDVIIGGNGTDTINGGFDSDLIIGGTTNYDIVGGAHATIVGIWAGAGNYATRVAAVQAGAFPLDDANIADDGVADVLRGGTGTTDDQLDLFFSSALDTLPDFGTGLETNVVVV